MSATKTVNVPPGLLRASQENSLLLVMVGWFLSLSLGSITMEDILTVLPFGGTVDLVQIKGSTVKKAFEHGVYRHGSMTGEFLQVSGLLLNSLTSLSVVMYEDNLESSYLNHFCFVLAPLQASMSSMTCPNQWTSASRPCLRSALSVVFLSMNP